MCYADIDGYPLSPEYCATYGISYFLGADAAISQASTPMRYRLRRHFTALPFGRQPFLWSYFGLYRLSRPSTAISRDAREEPILLF